MARGKDNYLKATIQADVFKTLIKNAEKFLRKDSSNKMMNYIFLEINAETMEMTAKAVDGHRVSKEKTRLKEADCSFTCFIKPNIPKITRYDLDATVELINGKCFVQVSESIVGYVQPEGEYINLEKIINETEQKEVKAHVFVDANLLKEALASVEVKGNTRQYVKLEIRDKNDPVIVRYGLGHLKDNVKLVLPVRVER